MLSELELHYKKNKLVCCECADIPGGADYREELEVPTEAEACNTMGQNITNQGGTPGLPTIVPPPVEPPDASLAPVQIFPGYWIDLVEDGFFTHSSIQYGDSVDDSFEGVAIPVVEAFSFVRMVFRLSDAINCDGVRIILVVNDIDTLLLVELTEVGVTVRADVDVGVGVGDLVGLRYEFINSVSGQVDVIGTLGIKADDFLLQPSHNHASYFPAARRYDPYGITFSHPTSSSILSTNDTESFLPIDIYVRSLTHYLTTATYDSVDAPQTLSFRQGHSDVGNLITANLGVVSNLPQDFSIPAVTNANINTSGIVGLRIFNEVTSNEIGGGTMYSYESIPEASSGHQVFHRYLTINPNVLPAYYEFVQQSFAAFTDFDQESRISCPWACAGSFQRFKLVADLATPINGDFLIYLRRNGAIVATFPIATGTRLFEFSDVVPVAVGDYFSWSVTSTAGSGTQFWHLVWTFKSSEA